MLTEEERADVWLRARVNGQFAPSTKYPGRYDVNGNFTLQPTDTEIEVPIGIVSGSFFVGVMFDDDQRMCCRLESLHNGQVEVARNFNLARAPIKSLEYGPQVVGGDYSAAKTKVASLEHIAPVIGGCLNVSRTPFSDQAAKYLLWPFAMKSSFTSVSFFKTELAVENIINKHLAEGDMLTCQEELIDAGFAQCARLPPKG